MARSRSSSSRNNSTANLGFEAKLWLAADKLRDLIGTIELIPRSGSAGASPALIGAPADQPSSSHRTKDILGRVYEYFLGQFASAITRRHARPFLAASSALENKHA